MVYYNPYLTGYYNRLYNPTNQGFFHCSFWDFPGTKVVFSKFRSGLFFRNSMNLCFFWHKDGCKIQGTPWKISRLVHQKIARKIIPTKPAFFELQHGPSRFSSRYASFLMGKFDPISLCVLYLRFLVSLYLGQHENHSTRGHSKANIRKYRPQDFFQT